jgi:hypothetical protein
LGNNCQSNLGTRAQPFTARPISAEVPEHLGKKRWHGPRAPLPDLRTGYHRTAGRRLKTVAANVESSRRLILNYADLTACCRIFAETEKGPPTAGALLLFCRTHKKGLRPRGPSRLQSRENSGTCERGPTGSNTDPWPLAGQGSTRLSHFPRRPPNIFRSSEFARWPEPPGGTRGASSGRI